jgi:hypothetical protein
MQLSANQMEITARAPDRERDIAPRLFDDRRPFFIGSGQQCIAEIFLPLVAIRRPIHPVYSHPRRYNTLRPL